MFEIMKNIGRFITGDKPTGKVLLYSVYKSEGVMVLLNKY